MIGYDRPAQREAERLSAYAPEDRVVLHRWSCHAPDQHLRAAVWATVRYVLPSTSPKYPGVVEPSLIVRADDAALGVRELWPATGDHWRPWACPNAVIPAALLDPRTGHRHLPPSASGTAA